MRYSVLWDQWVEADFIDAWTKSDAQSRAALSEIANTIDRALSRGPETLGQLQPDGATRAAIVRVAATSVTVYFETFPQERQVVVYRLNFRRAE
jgi:hypothetical protein